MPEPLSERTPASQPDTISSMPGMRDPETDLELRHELGLDRFDEEWDGDYRMSPSPGPEHARIGAELTAFLLACVKERLGGTLFGETNVFRDAAARRDYRVPDLSYVAAGRESVIGENGIHGDGPDAVVEIRSPGDDTDRKVSFYAAVGVREVVIVDSVSKTPEVHRRSEGRLVRTPEQDGWVRSEVFQVRFRRVAAEPARLEVENLRDSGRRVII